MSNINKTAIIENWVGIDKIIFRNESPKKVLDENSLAQYKEYKNCMLLNLHEIYSILEQSPAFKHKNLQELDVYMTKKASIIEEEVKEILKSDEAKQSIKEQISLTEGIENHTKIVKEMFLKTAIDIMLFENVDSLNLLNDDPQGKILIDAHRKLRDKMIGVVI
jgi:hypothetical protein